MSFNFDEEEFLAYQDGTLKTENTITFINDTTQEKIFIVRPNKYHINMFLMYCKRLFYNSPTDVKKVIFSNKNSSCEIILSNEYNIHEFKNLTDACKKFFIL